MKNIGMLNEALKWYKKLLAENVEENSPFREYLRGAVNGLEYAIRILKNNSGK